MRKKLMFLKAIIPWLAAEVILSIIANILYILYHRLLSQPINSVLTDEASYLCNSVAVALCGIIFFFWYRNEKSGESRGTKKNIISVKTISCIVLLGVGCQLFIAGLLALLSTYFVDFFADYSNVVKKLMSGNAIIVVLLTVIIAPIVEELIFRGMVLHRANRYIPFLWANFLQAFLFGVYHGNVIQGIYAILLGLLLGMIYYKYKTILAPILLHMCINASAYLNYLLPEATAVYIIIILIGGICACTAFYLIKPMENAEE